ncbi:MAG: hypothetical protein P1U58_09565 [Verrucomicrobiales bacterium]|nr:hypothetical protein [Verrucomicrobiales bacterium]
MNLSSFSALFSIFVGLSFLPSQVRAEKEVKERIKVASVNPDVMKSRGISDAGWTLRDDEGREIQAMLLSAHGDMVKIQRVDNDQEFDVPISMFDPETEGRIRYWIEEDPEAVDFAVNVSATREMADSSTVELSGRSFTKKEWTYKVIIHNATRNDLNDALVEFRIVYDDNVNFVRTSASPGIGPNQQDGQAVDLPLMQFNDEIEFNTPIVETDAYEYKPSRGDREFLKDEIKGIWVRVIRHDEIIAEFKSNEAAMSNLSWDNAEEVEITITNRFKESFGEESEE